MNTLTMLKRTTAVAAIAALPLAPMLAHADSAQATGVQPPATEETNASTQEAGTGKTESFGQTTEAPVDSAEAESADAGSEDSAGVRAAESADAVGGADDDTEKTAAELESDQSEAGLVVPGGEGTQSGEAPDGDETLEAETDEEDVFDATTETGAVTEGAEGTQSGDTADEAETGGQSGQGDQDTRSQMDQNDKAPTGQAAEAQAEQDGSEAGQDTQAEAGGGQDALVATVGDREIRQSDIVSVISMLPPELQQQPAETLVPIALDQLVMRELILKEAQDAGLESDPLVEDLGSEAPEQAKEDAMVQAWLSEELGKAVTEEKVEETYDGLKQQFGDQAPPMESIRPQIEQELRQQAFLDISKELQKDADVTLYGPDGQPIEQPGGQSSTQ